jgi:hypothetical protein
MGDPVKQILPVILASFPLVIMIGVWSGTN